MPGRDDFEVVGLSMENHIDDQKRVFFENRTELYDQILYDQILIPCVI